VAPADILGIDPNIICHKLSIKVDAKSVKQKPRRMNEKWSRAISDEVDPRLLGRLHLRDILHRLALQSHPREEEEYQVEGLH